MTTTTASAPVAASATTPAATPASGHILAVAGRVLIAAIFILSGLNKIANPDATIGYIASAGLPFAPAALIAAALIEVGGGLALIAGFRTRAIALTLAGFSVVTALAFHANLADQNQFIHFFKNLAMAGGLLQVAAFGSGRIGLDRRLTCHQPKRETAAGSLRPLDPQSKTAAGSLRPPSFRLRSALAIRT